MAILLLCIICSRITQNAMKRSSINVICLVLFGQIEDQISNMAKDLSPQQIMHCTTKINLVFNAQYQSGFWGTQRVTYLQKKKRNRKLIYQVGYFKENKCLLPDPMDCPLKGLNKHFQLLPIILLLPATWLLPCLENRSKDKHQDIIFQNFKGTN